MIIHREITTVSSRIESEQDKVSPTMTLSLSSSKLQEIICLSHVTCHKIWMNWCVELGWEGDTYYTGFYQTILNFHCIMVLIIKGNVIMFLSLFTMSPACHWHFALCTLFRLLSIFVMYLRIISIHFHADVCNVHIGALKIFLVFKYIFQSRLGLYRLGLPIHRPNMWLLVMI